MKYRLIISSLFFLIFCSNNGSAQNNSLLWEISGNGLKSPSYLFGTMHVKDKRAFLFHDSLMLKMKSCQTFAGELVLDKDAAKEMASDILLPQGKELKTLLTEQEFKRVKKFCSKRIGPMSILINKLKPIFTSAMLSESLLESDMPKALDEYLQEKAKDFKLSVKGLETIQEQMKALDEMTIEEQAKMLVDQIDNIQEERVAIQKMADVYASQNLESIYMLIQTPEMQGEFGDALIKNRNSIMTERLENLLKTETVFCAVGAAHLPGDDGIIFLLRKKGYNLRPIVKTK